MNNLFGFSGDNKPSKLIVRDSMMSEASKEQLLSCDNLDMPYTENKFENVIDRVRGVAEHPRQTERVPAGVVFNVEFVINIWDTDDETKFLHLLEKGIRLLERDYLGGSGSRGYGQIVFGERKQTEYSEANNWND